MKFQCNDVIYWNECLSILINHFLEDFRLVINVKKADFLCLVAACNDQIIICVQYM